jgi:hypothetical protein
VGKNKRVLSANKSPRDREVKSRIRPGEMPYLAEEAGSIGAFELDSATDNWEWTALMAPLFDFASGTPKHSFADWDGL